MLVLSRKEGEKIHIGNDIVISLEKIKGNAVRIGIEAPTNLTILRGELVNSGVELNPAQVAAARAAAEAQTPVQGESSVVQ